MSSRSLSPGGALLRRSKVFSIPAPLPRSLDTAINRQVLSKTSTTPSPSHLSITTPLSSLKEGDWGLKRPLPLRTTTKTSSPSVRIEAIDTFEKITSFRSSADHSITLLKWQELDLPITTSKLYRDDIKPARISVFEDEIDTLEDHKDKTLSNKNTVLRWKFNGPWLGGQCDGEFSVYLKTQVQTRKKEFQDFLRREYAKAKTTDARNVFISEGLEGTMPHYDVSDIGDEEFALFVKNLRYGRVALNKLIRAFLDLPPSLLADLSDLTLDIDAIFNNNVEKIKNLDQNRNSSWKGPPKTHPSAGISYSRTNAHLFNHPQFGPQAKKPPVQARVINPKVFYQRSSNKALVGVAGFVSNVPLGFESHHGFKRGQKMSNDFNYSKFPGLQYIDANAECGSKSWVHPTHAEIDPKGRVQISWELGDPEAVAVVTDKVHEIIRNPMPAMSLSGYWLPKKKIGVRTSSARQYGLQSMIGSSGNEPSKNQTISELGSLLADTDEIY